jgi:hypothetical protein
MGRGNGHVSRESPMQIGGPQKRPDPQCVHQASAPYLVDTVDVRRPWIRRRRSTNESIDVVATEPGVRDGGESRFQRECGDPAIRVAHDLRCTDTNEGD